MAGVTVTPYFTPTSITGCCMWLDAQDNSVISLTSGRVSSVTDKALGTTFTSVGSTPANLTVASASINSFQSFYFNNSAGNYAGLRGNLAQLTTGTAIFVMKYISSQNGPWRGIFGWNDTTSVQSISFGMNLNGTGTVGPYVQNIGYNGSATATLTNNGLYIVTFTFTGTTTGVGYNGQLSLTAGTVSSYSGSSTSLGICTEANGTQMTAVYLGELIIYNTVLGSTDRQKVESYLAQKWGIQSSLAATHPGLTITYYNSQSILSRAALTVAPILSKIPIILSGLTNRWALNEGSGSVFYDSVSGQTGTLIGATSWVSAVNTRLPGLTNAIYFANTSGNGNSQYGQIVSGGIGINTLTTANWSISVWFKALTFVAQGADVYFSINSPTTRYWNFYVGNGSGNLYNYSGSGAGGSTSISGTVATNVWSHIAYTCSSSSITVYVNGSSAGSGTWPSFSFPANTYLTIGIENINSGSLNYGVNMYMQDVRIYNRALSATEVTAIYNNLG